MAPWNMKGIVDKAIYFGNDNIILTERGTSFGYNRLIVDMCGLDAMAEEREIPIIFDATHSVQEPGGLGSSSGGKRKYATMLAKSAIATRPIAGIFCEVHDNPDIAPSDGPNTLNFKMITELLPILKEIDAITKRIN